jgi:hypothetical protein
MSTRTRLRAAYDHLADLAPEIANLELDFAGSARERARTQHGRRLRASLAVAATACVMLLVVCAAVSIRRTIDGRRGDSTHALPAPPPPYPTDFAFASSSMPSQQWQLADSTLSPLRRTNTFVGDCAQLAAAPAAYCTIYLADFVPDATAQEEITALPTRGVASAKYRLASFDSAVSGSAASELANLARPAALSNRVRPTLLWPTSGGAWIALTGDVQTDSTDGTAHDAALTADQLAAYRSTIRPLAAHEVSPVRFGGLPTGLRFAAVAMTESGKYPVAGRPNLLGNAVNGPYWTLSFVDRSVPAQVAADHNPTVDVTLLNNSHLPSLDQATAAELRYRGGPGSWTRTTVGGHVAWVGPHGLIVQLGALQVSVATPGSAAGPTPSIDELKQVAAAITGVDQTGFPLIEAVPAAALR